MQLSCLRSYRSNAWTEIPNILKLVVLLTDNIFSIAWFENLKDVPVYFAWKKIDWEYFFAKSICLGARMNECVGYRKVFLLFQVRVDCEIIVSHWITDFSFKNQ